MLKLKSYDPLGPGFVRLGRREAGETACALWWSGSGVRTRLACSAMEVEIAAGGELTPWICVEADGAPVARLPLCEGVRRYLVLSGMDPAVPHEITLRRDSQPTEADRGPVILRQVFTDGEPVAPELPKRRVLFIGDSLTVGEGTLGPVSAMEWRLPWISNEPAFPSLTAARLGAEKEVLALGGWGTWRGWDGDTSHHIGRIFEQLCGVVPGGEAPYAFDRPAPDAVVINLGTNDASAVRLLDESERPQALEEVADCAAALMEKVRMRAPQAWILWSYGLCGDELRAPLEAAVERRRAAGDEKVRYLALTGCGDDLGARSHPSRAAHRRATEEIAGALEPLIGEAQ